MMGIRQICHGDGWWRVICILDYWGAVMVVIPKSKRKAMNRNWSNQKANPALKTKAGNK